VTNCTVTGSSGSALLDSTACSLLRRRARFTPAEDASGNKIPANYSGKFRWEIPKD
jgi:protein TonB